MNAGGLGRPSGVAYAISSDGMLHVVGLQSGKDLQKPAQFVPANSRFSDPIAVNTTMYATTGGNCGGAANGVYAIDLESEAKPVVSWKTNGGSVVGGVAFTTDGSSALVAVGAGQAASGGYANAIVALDPKTLQVKDWYTQPDADFVTSPLVFRIGDKDFVAAATKDGRVIVLDTTSLGGANHNTPHMASPAIAGATFAPGALAYFQEAPVQVEQAPAGAPAPASGGASWLLVPVAGRTAAGAQGAAANGAVTNGTIVALKIGQAGGKISLTPGWTSRDLTAPATPIIVNGVVFALSAGRTGGAAVLYALNGANGKELWNSGRTMTLPVPGRGFWSANSQVYTATSDGTVHAYGFLVERR